MNEVLKYCKGCKKELPIANFYKHKDKNGKYYFSSCYCKKCEIFNRKEYMEKYAKENKEHLQEYRKQKYQESKESKIEYQKAYYQKHKEEKALYDKEYRQKYKNIKNTKELEKLHNDKIYHLKYQLRNCIYRSFTRKKYCKNYHTEDIIGCNINYFINYLLKTYKNNYGCEWDGIEPIHIDHIKPLKYAKTEEEVIKMCHFSNLQLLKAKDNLIKGSKINYNGGDY